MERVNVLFLMIVVLSSCGFLGDAVSTCLVSKYPRPKNLIEVSDEFMEKFAYPRICGQCVSKDVFTSNKLDSILLDFEEKTGIKIDVVSPIVWLEKIWNKGDSVKLYFFYYHVPSIYDNYFCECKKNDQRYVRYIFLRRENVVAFYKDSMMCFNIFTDLGNIRAFLKKNKMGWFRRQILYTKLLMLERGGVVPIYYDQSW